MSTNSSVTTQRQDLGRHRVAQPLVGDVQWRVLESLEGDEGLHPVECRVPRQAIAPVLAVHSRQAAHTGSRLVDRQRPGGVARIGAARDDVLHDHQEVGALLVDERGVDRRMIKRQCDARGEQPRFVVQAAGQRDEFGVSRGRRPWRTPSRARSPPSTSAPAGHAGWCRRRVARPARSSTTAPGW